MQYRVCPYCGDHLDHGERCDCRDKKEAAPVQWERPQTKRATFTLTDSKEEVKLFFGQKGGADNA